ncbi:FecR family protein [Chitinophaga vietnamensis]|uniref:FecR family protein n=1 Tax=Chitinophaga vietnamensis TaxID=2593957 RepID=UPI001178440B|nr:FecR domain-containing protein [Chitinophaga vietnamensis]
MTVIPDNIQYIIVNKLQGLATPAEETMLEAWRLESAAHDEELQHYYSLWAASGWALSHADFDTARAWQRVDSRLRRSASPRMVYLKVAAAAAVALLLVFAGWQLFNRQREKVSEEVVVVAQNTNMYVRLPDSSLVLLRKGATIRYPATFGRRNRQLSLSGDAYFDIAQKADLPFQVQTDRSLVKVLGTSFVINTSAKNDHIVVITGKVMFSANADPEQHCTLAAQEEASYNGKSIEKKKVSDANYLSWQTDALSFTNAPLEEVVKDLSAYYKLTIKLNDTLNAAGVKVTASFRKQPLREVLDEITAITGLHYHNLKKDTLIIY